MNKILILFVVGFLLILPLNVQADIGPKPSMKFHLIYETTKTPIEYGKQLQCEDKKCSNYAPLESYGPQGFGCAEKYGGDGDFCSSLAYGYSTSYQKLRITFSDKVRESNVFKTDSFEAYFNVTVTNSDLIIKEIQPFNPDSIANFKIYEVKDEKGKIKDNTKHTVEPKNIIELIISFFRNLFSFMF